ncbi:recombinase family protein [Corynebacterium coyleae]|uniref:recombinase family protein n=1 Tax=Corynebacterium coyleae TaxID=53374 RepID=UPI00254FFBB7|nr:recombinase family protein [Corynebacterium coyleae]MDK8663823.1 recombinase family protein [Corynebacterium coyleae]MDK8706636.1 recombinase family protein [Corynebacterium coyleae]MDK8733625.1 recombinase family protein [Corynebacterium coyleae]MDK8892821.1 recombinase family protein [Corynebacterium coyleae]
MARTVTAIPATRALHTGAPLGQTTLRRVAGYARVSTDHDDQVTSYEAQVDYYTRYISDHAGWQFVKVYTDEGITGTSTKHRAGFQQMVIDALDGKIDLIITKSVSRFARNTVDSLTTVRALKDKGVEVFFEKEGIWTFDAKGELLITIMSSLAQEEARSISENVTWGHRKRFADGKVTVPYSRFLGYDKGEDGSLVINTEQAKLVRRIYNMYLGGMSIGTIARTLTDEPETFTAAGNKTWYYQSVRSILTNEKYKGDALLQKSYTADFLTKKQVINEGEVPQYYVTASHEAIISPAVWDFVQAEIAKGARDQRTQHRTRPFSSTLICGQCGHFFGSKTWHAGSKYEKVIWRCGQKYSGQEKCATGHISDQRLKDMFLKAIRLRFGSPTDTGVNQAVLDALDTSDLEVEAAGLLAQINEVAKKLQSMIARNARVAQDQQVYEKAFNASHEQHQTLLAEHAAVVAEIQNKNNRLAAYHYYRQETANLDLEQLAFSPYLCVALLDKGVVDVDGNVTFQFRDGSTQVVAIKQ